MYTHLVLTGELTLAQLVERMTRFPARAFGLPWGVLKEGGIADLTVVDLAAERVVNPQEFASKGKNTPFIGWKLKGWPVITLRAGEIIYRDPELG